MCSFHKSRLHLGSTSEQTNIKPSPSLWLAAVPRPLQMGGGRGWLYAYGIKNKAPPFGEQRDSCSVARGFFIRSTEEHRHPLRPSFSGHLMRWPRGGSGGNEVEFMVRTPHACPCSSKVLVRGCGGGESSGTLLQDHPRPGSNFYTRARSPMNFVVKPSYEVLGGARDEDS